MCPAVNFCNWLYDEDQSWQDVNDIICDMPQPMMSNRGHLTFPKKSFKKAEEKSMDQESVTFVHFKACVCYCLKIHYTSDLITQMKLK